MGQHEIDTESLPYAVDKLPRKPDVGIDAFFALDLRAGRVVAVENFPEARKPSWKIAVDFGSKRIAGFRSEFLILGALDPDGVVRLLQLEDGVAPGAPIA